MTIDTKNNHFARFVVDKVTYKRVQDCARWYGLSVSSFIRTAVMAKVNETMVEMCRQKSLALDTTSDASVSKLG